VDRADPITAHQSTAGNWKTGTCRQQALPGQLLPFFDQNFSAFEWLLLESLSKFEVRREWPMQIRQALPPPAFGV
jgi:hypothetical protein